MLVPNLYKEEIQYIITGRKNTVWLVSNNGKKVFLIQIFSLNFKGPGPDIFFPS